MQAERANQLVELLVVLHGLYDEVGIPADDLARRALDRCLSGPARLHAATMAQARSCQLIQPSPLDWNRGSLQ